ncbi:hypothetical protein CAP40_03060 [Sphingomonas sp. IBVSS2]|uniref:DUF6891 domain-containing protein n=1 Tax=Sphingomonas sp. IBVSS2 TaxID=1985172 RepID=UPI000A2D5D67|nr:hypothetical protein [Sphingomonas sp. IBVSS2]OSZ70402.1 hypothetical protein CAP40_03060 [Sphingomonas sp. IBVSS2]
MKSLFGRLFGKRAAPQPEAALAPPATPLAEKTEWVRDQIRRDVASGFYDEDAILTNASDAFADDLSPDELRPLAQKLLRQALAEQRAAERLWPGETDCDRLDAAFAALEESGVIARQNFSCCGNCGATEIWDEVRAAEDAGGAARGYAFYHMQDTESAVDGGGLYLNYGACDEGEDAALAVAREIVAELEAHGLETRWDGSWDQRIGVALDWKRRRGI